MSLCARRGDLFCFSRDEYEDRCVIGYFVASKDITAEDFETTAKALLGRWAKATWQGLPFDIYAEVIDALVNAGCLSSVSVTECHLGVNGRLEIEVSS